MLFKKKKSEDDTNQAENQTKQILRAGDIDLNEDDLSEEEINAIVSSYMPLRRIKLLAKAFLRLDKIRIIFLCCIILVALLFIASFS